MCLKAREIEFVLAEGETILAEIYNAILIKIATVISA